MVHVYQPPNHALYQGSNEEKNRGQITKKNTSLNIDNGCGKFLHVIFFADIDKCLLKCPRKIEKGHRTLSFEDFVISQDLILNRGPNNIKKGQ